MAYMFDPTHLNRTICQAKLRIAATLMKFDSAFYLIDAVPSVGNCARCRPFGLKLTMEWRFLGRCTTSANGCANGVRDLLSSTSAKGQWTKPLAR